MYIYTLPQKGSWKVTFFFSPILRVLTTGKSLKCGDFCLEQWPHWEQTNHTMIWGLSTILFQGLNPLVFVIWGLSTFSESVNQPYYGIQVV